MQITPEELLKLTEDLKNEYVYPALRELEQKEKALQNRQPMSHKDDAKNYLMAGIIKDNWKHRSKGMRCKTCVFFVPKVADCRPITAKEVVESVGAFPEVAPSYDLGRCRRHAPTMSGWPSMFANDWCGDHRLDENKLDQR